MDKKKKGSFKVGEWSVEPDLDRLTRGSETVDLRPQVMQLLVYLAGRPGEVVRADQLLEALWPHKLVTHASIYNCIAELRHALAPGVDGSHYVQTIPKKGYRLVAPVSRPEPGETGPVADGRAAGRSTGMTAWNMGILISLLFAALLAFHQFTIDSPVTESKPESAKPSVVVLPFSDLSPEGDHAYFCEGITEELVNGLSQLGELRVVSLASSKALVDAGLSAPELADKLDAGYVLEGSVRKSGNLVRITAQLIDARGDSHLWSQTFDRPLADIFAIQDEISARVLDELKVRVLGPAPSARATDPRAFELFLRGRYLVSKRSADAFREAVVLFEQASEIDPYYAPAQAGLAKALHLMAPAGYVDSELLRHRTEAAIKRALELDPQNADALAVKGLTFDGKDLDAARSYYRRAIESNPNNSDARRWLALTYSEPEPVRYLEIIHDAYLVDPLLPSMNFHRVVALSRLGRHAEALDAAREWHDLAPGVPDPYAMAGNLHARDGDLAKAVRSYYAAYRRAPDGGLRGDLPWLLLDLNERELADAWVQHAGRVSPARMLVPQVVVADLLGRHEQALGLLAETEEQHPEWWAETGRAHILLDDFERSLQAFERGLVDPDMEILRSVSDNWGMTKVVNYALALQRTGASRRASALIAEALALTEEQINSGMQYYGEWTNVRAGPQFHAAALHAIRGDTRQCLEALRRDASGGSASCPVCLLIWPHFDGLRDDPAFIALVARQDEVNATRRQRLADEGLLLTPEQVLSLEKSDEYDLAELFDLE